MTPWRIPPGSSVRGFPRQECWSGLPFPSPWDLPHPGIKAMSPALKAGSLALSHLGSPSCFYQSIYLAARDKHLPALSGNSEEFDILATSVKFPPDYSEQGD